MIRIELQLDNYNILVKLFVVSYIIVVCYNGTTLVNQIQLLSCSKIMTSTSYNISKNALLFFY